jgi:hypothetical protein
MDYDKSVRRERRSLYLSPDVQHGWLAGKLLLILVSTVILGSESRWTHDCSLLSNSLSQVQNCYDVDLELYSMAAENYFRAIKAVEAGNSALKCGLSSDKFN